MPIIAEHPSSSLIVRQSVGEDGSLKHSPLVESELLRQMDPDQQGLLLDLNLSERDLRLLVIGMIEGRESAAKTVDKWRNRGGVSMLRQISNEIRKGLE